MKDNDIQAFPNPTLADTQNCSITMLNDDKEYGMTLRDYFAGQALTNMNGDNNNVFGMATSAYKLADAMLKAREL